VKKIIKKLLSKNVKSGWAKTKTQKRNINTTTYHQNKKVEVLIRIKATPQ